MVKEKKILKPNEKFVVASYNDDGTLVGYLKQEKACDCVVSNLKDADSYDLEVFCPFADGQTWMFGGENCERKGYYKIQKVKIKPVVKKEKIYFTEKEFCDGVVDGWIRSQGVFGHLKPTKKELKDYVKQVIKNRNEKTK